MDPKRLFGSSTDGKTCPSGGFCYAYGLLEPAIDSVVTSTVYIGSAYLGFFRSENCGSTWTKFNTGRNADKIDGGRLHSLKSDPLTSQLLYTVLVYGAPGVWMTRDGGLNWDNVLPSDGNGNVLLVTASGDGIGDVYNVDLDPNDHFHLLATLRSDEGLLEGWYHPSTSTPDVDGAKCWAATHGEWPGRWCWQYHAGSAGMGGSPYAYILGNAKSWVVAQIAYGGATQSFYTLDGGKTFKATEGDVFLHTHGGGEIYRTKVNGANSYYLTTLQGVVHSSDGITWKSVGGGSGYNNMAIVGDGSRIYSLIEDWPGNPFGPIIYSAPESPDLSNWSAYGSQKFGSGEGSAGAAMDTGRGIIYSGNWTGGIYRLFVR